MKIKNILNKAIEQGEIQAQYEGAMRKAAATLKEKLNLASDKDGESEATRAIGWWRKLNKNYKKFLFISQVEAAVDNWLFMKDLTEKAGAGKGFEKRSMSDEMRKIAQVLRQMIPELSGEEDYMEVVYRAVDKFLEDTEKIKQKKEPFPICKISINDLTENAEGNLVCDTSTADEFTTKRIKVDRNNKTGRVLRMRIVNTAESGLSRELQAEVAKAKEAGLDVEATMPIAIFVDVDPCADLTKEERKDEEIVYAALKAHKDKLSKFLHEGFTDVATGAHYMHAEKGASMTRKATHFCLGGLKDWNDVINFYCKILGGTPEEASLAFGKTVSLSKVPAYLALCMSGSFDPKKNVGANMSRYNSRVIFVKDVSIFVDRPYRKMIQDEETEDSAYHFEEILSDPQEKTLADGQGLMSVEFALDLGYDRKDITGVEYARAKFFWNTLPAEYDMAKAPQWFLITLEKCAAKQKRVFGTGIKGMLFAFNKKQPGLKATKTYREVCYIIPDGVNPDDIVDLSKFDLILPKSMVKFLIPGKFDCANITICASNKRRKDRWVRMNSQFVSALWWEADHADITQIVKDHLETIKKSLVDPIWAAKFHKAFGTSASSVVSTLKEVVMNAPFLLDEPQVQEWRKNQVEKAVRELGQCVIPVPGVYGYEVCDPYMFMNATFGCNALCLPSGYSYFNGKGGEACLFRSPLLEHKCVVKTKLMSSSEYRHYQIYVDCVVFNGYDGLWDSMSGSDFDGDTCAIVPDDTWQGKIIVDGYREDGLEVGGYSKSSPKIALDFTDAKKMEDMFCEFFLKFSHRDRTGFITNCQTRSQELANHLRMIARTATQKGCLIEFVDPASYKYGCGCNVYPEFKGGKIVAKGLCPYLGYDKETKKNLFDYDSDWSLVGDKTAEEVLEVAKWVEENPVAAMFVYQSQEIDGAKTGFLPTIIKDLIMTIEPRNTFTKRRRVYKGLSDEDYMKPYLVNNSYMSISFWGIIAKMIDRDVYDCHYEKNGEYVHNNLIYYDEFGDAYYNDKNGKRIYIDWKDPDLVIGKDEQERKFVALTWYDRFMASANVHAKTDLLLSLLTDEEKDVIYKKRIYNGKTWTVIDQLREKRSKYVTEIKDFKDFCESENDSSEDSGEMSSDDHEEAFGNLKMQDIKDKYIEDMTKSCDRLGISLEVIAAACYIANYTDKDGKDRGDVRKGNSFAWLFWEDLLHVFMRKDDTWQLVECRATGAITVKDGVMYADDVAVTTIDAYDTDGEAETIIANNDKRYAYIRMHVEALRKERVANYQIADRRTFKVNMFGLKAGSPADVIKMIKEHGGFDIMLEEDKEGSQLCAYIDGKKLGVLNVNRNMTATMNLDGASVSITNEGEKLTKGSIVGLEVVIKPSAMQSNPATTEG